MNNIIKKTISTILSICMLISTFSLLGTVAFAASEYDSGNMPKAFFNQSYWTSNTNDTSAYKLADESIKFSRTFIKDFGSYKNDGFETMFKIAGGFELTFRANSDASEGYVLGLQAPRNGSTSMYLNFYIRKAESSSWLAQSSAIRNDFKYGEWSKLSVDFTDKNGATEIEFKINDYKLDFYLSSDTTNSSYADLVADIDIRNGNFIDYSAVSQDNSYIKVRPYYNGGFESSPNRDNQLYFASVDNKDKVTEGNFVTRIACVGDSITQGVGASNITSESYVATLQKKLGPNYDVYNCGASANTAMTDTYSCYTIQVIYYSAMLFKPDYVIFALGTNDGQSVYWDKFSYYGPSKSNSSNKWHSVTVAQDENGDYIGSVTYADDGVTVKEKITVENDTYTYYFLDSNGTAHTYNLNKSAEERYIAEANGIINNFINNPYHGNYGTKIILSSVMHTWGDLGDTWNRQAEAFEAQNKLLARNENIIGIVDNFTMTEIYNEDSTSANYYKNFSDDGLHPNTAGHAILGNNVYNYLNQNINLTTDDKAINYTSHTNANSNVVIRELDSSINSTYFTGSNRSSSTTSGINSIENATISTVNKFNLGYQFDAKISMAYAQGYMAGTYSQETTDYTYINDVRHSFGDLQLRMWRLKDANNAITYVLGLFYKNKLVGNYQTYTTNDTSYNEYSCGDRIDLDISFNDGNMAVNMKRLFKGTSNSKLETWDLSGVEGVKVYSIDKETFLSSIGATTTPLINFVRFSSSGRYARGAKFIGLSLKANGAEISSNIQTTEGGKIYANGALFDNTVQRYEGEEATLKAVIDDETYYRFNSWQDSNGNILSTDTEYHVVFTDGVDVIAVFDKIIYCDYSITATNGGSILMDGEAFVDGTLYEVGYTHTVSAVDNNGYTFVGWKNNDGEIVSLEADYTFVIGKNLSLEACFVETKYANSFDINALGGRYDYIARDKYVIGSYIKLTAIAADNYVFSGWFDANNNLVSDKSIFYYEIESENKLTAQFDYVLESKLTITANNGTVKVNGGEFDANATYYAGDNYELKAIANDGYTFKYWIINDMISSYNESITIKLAAVSNVEAVFANSEVESVTVNFVNRANEINSTITVTKGSEITLPSLPTSFGYTYNGWLVNEELFSAGAKINVNEDIVITANAVVNSKKYNVTVIGSTDDEGHTGEYSYNDKITLHFDQLILGENEYFGGWANERNEVISYAEIYTFFVGADVDVIAIIIENEVTAKPIVAITDTAVVEDGKKVSFLAQRTVPDSVKFIESGVIYTSNVNLADSMTLENIGGAIRSKAATYNTPNGQMRMTLSSREGTAITVYLRAYLTYMENGEYVTIYTDVYSASTVTSGNIDTGIEEGEDFDF
ncbi:MAG: InlB B-repeat-containing protein [Clostridia bacterium]|nr:InlB B-repeat-containing protein [Clostridia bacterium]